MKKTILALMMAFSILIGLSTAQAQIVHDLESVNVNDVDTTLDMTGTGGITIDAITNIETTALGAVITLDAILLENTAITDVTSYNFLGQNTGAISSIANFTDDTSISVTDSVITTTAMASVIEVNLEDQNTPLAASLDFTIDNNGNQISAITNMTSPVINFSAGTLNTTGIGTNVGITSVTHGVVTP